MALSKTQKDDVVGKISDLLDASKLTVVAAYQGTTVKALQQLRRDAKEQGTKVQVVKNRLFIKALAGHDKLKDADTAGLNGMLLYAFNDQDEVAPAQTLKAFAKTNPTLQFVGAYSADGTFMNAEEVKTLADLPSKDVLIGQVVETLLSPVHDITNGLSGNLHALLDGVEAKATA
ncbi:MAG: large subunit ribosomal protein [Patescibacteria group bacterium]|nr:50S ribosomal protein L10 [Candidatus Saccharibacteria bacterium]MDQ5963645.1 large subunit ribosomal protein [Patescibacteria group bacterium]